VEITERALTARPAELLQSVTRIRENGWGIAVDDVGADRHSLALLPFLRPDVIKLDLRLVQGNPSADIAEIVIAANDAAERTGAVVLADLDNLTTDRDVPMQPERIADFGEIRVVDMATRNQAQRVFNGQDTQPFQLFRNLRSDPGQARDRGVERKWLNHGRGPRLSWFGWTTRSPFTQGTVELADFLAALGQTEERLNRLETGCDDFYPLTPWRLGGGKALEHGDGFAQNRGDLVGDANARLQRAERVDRNLDVV